MRNLTWARRLMGAASICLFATTAMGQIQITEIMYDSSQSPESKWEWIEVRNTSTNSIDLNGYYLDDDDGTALTSPSIDAINGGNTVIPGGGVAVLYNGSSLAFDDSRFRSAWGLAPSIPLVAVSPNPGLSNSGDAIGLWSSSNYALDIMDTDGDGDLEVAQFTNSAATVDYSTTNGFPAAGNGQSVYWNGNGSYGDGSQWLGSVEGVDHARLSVEVSVQSQINSSDDTANAGIIPTGNIPAGLHITEVMYNPRSPENSAEWEWIEVHNNTGSAIDFAVTPFTLDDNDGGALTEENLTSGMIANGETAIIFNDLITQQNISDAFPQASKFIAAANWPGLSNSGDDFGLWSSFSDYTSDQLAGTFDNATVSLSYTDDPPFPQDDGSGSIYLTDLGADPADGANWAISQLGDGIGSYNASPAIGTFVDHAGGDLGSPGQMGSATTIDGDFNDDGVYGCADVDALVSDIANGNNTGSFDLTGDGVVDMSDLDAWRSEAGEALLGPGLSILPGDATLDGSVDVSDRSQWNAFKFTQSAAWCKGDFNASGATDVTDLGIWTANSFRISGNLAAVPEPTGFALLLAGLLPLLFRRRR